MSFHTSKELLKRTLKRRWLLCLGCFHTSKELLKPLVRRGSWNKKRSFHTSKELLKLVYDRIYVTELLYVSIPLRNY